MLIQGHTFMCVHTCVHAYMVSASTCVCAHEGQRLTMSTLFSGSPPYTLRQALSLEPRAHIFT
ncbi:mCG148041 [Mus musculus]|nr:mCG148041 [Mus musculus]